MGICCMAQKTQGGALYQPRGVGWGRRWEGDQKGGDICIPMPDSCWGLTENSKILWSNSVQFSHVWPLQTHELQHAKPPCPSPTLGVYSNSCPLSWWCHPTISSSVIPSPPAFSLSKHQGLFQWVNSSHQVAKVLEFQLQHQSFQ